MIYGIGASIDISVRSVLRESRPGFPARGHDSESKRKAHITGLWLTGMDGATLPGRFWLDGMGCALCSYGYGG